ncbi:MAG: ATP-binding protein [Anaerolineales bacterium]|jgi:PAS domain S-box-containing protein
MVSFTPLTNLTRFRRAPGLVEIESLLELIPDSALLVDRRSKRIVLANAKATELTTFTRSEFADMQCSTLFADSGFNVLEDFETGELSSKPLNLVKRNKAPIKVLVTGTNLSPQSNWLLLTLEPSKLIQQRRAEQQRRNELFSSMQTMSEALHQRELDPALDLFLQAAQRMTAASNLIIYLQSVTDDGRDIEVRQIAHLGDMDLLPTQLHAADIVQLRKPQFWVPGKRPSTSLHSTARAAGLAYLASAPLGHPEALIGLIAIAGNHPPLPERTLPQLQILANAISALIEQHTRVSNLVEALNTAMQKNTFHELVEGEISDSVIVLSPDLTILRLNRSAEKTLGYSNQEAKGHAVEDILISSQSLKPAFQIASQAVPTLNQENIHLFRRSGQVFLARFSTIPAIVENELQGIIVLIQDLTEEEQIKAQTQQLEQRALLGEVTAVFAHEVRNPINNISTGLELMAYNLPGDDPNQETIARLQSDCDRLSQLMKSVLAYAHQSDYELVPVDLGVLVSGMLHRLQHRLSKAKVHDHIQIDPDLPLIEGDRRALEQVFTNLVNNAIQAMSDEGGTLAIKIQHLKPSPDRQFIVIDVADDGPGIPKDNLDHIFQPFFTTKRDGTGLGLAITQRIITAHKGTIGVNSFPGGTVFRIQLPVLED